MPAHAAATTSADSHRPGSHSLIAPAECSLREANKSRQMLILCAAYKILTSVYLAPAQARGYHRTADSGYNSFTGLAMPHRYRHKSGMVHEPLWRTGLDSLGVSMECNVHNEPTHTLTASPHTIYTVTAPSITTSISGTCKQEKLSSAG